MFTSGIPAEFLWNSALKFQHFFLEGSYVKNKGSEAYKNAQVLNNIPKKYLKTKVYTEKNVKEDI